MFDDCSEDLLFACLFEDEYEYELRRGHAGGSVPGVAHGYVTEDGPPNTFYVTEDGSAVYTPE